jgi:PiT family inorganic phosphate transporter
MTLLALVVLIIAIALVFDFINGFHDAANSIATVIATRVFTPFQAVCWAAFFNFVAAFTFGTGVAKTIGKGFVDLDQVTLYVIMAGLIGAIAWDLITWWLGLPTSSTHALIGGYAGAALARGGFKALIVGEWPMTLAFIVVAPLLGFGLAYLYMIIVYNLFQRSTPARMDRIFRKLQMVSAAVFSFSHGTNDAQKTMGIITGVLVSAYKMSNGTIGLQTFNVPVWVIFSAHAAIGLGTLCGGWRIVHTMGGRLTRLKPRSGFCAELAAGTSILLSTELHLPVSTTHVIAGGIAGVGSIQRLKAVRWGIATNIVLAWGVTIPAAATIAWLAFVIIRFFEPSA